MPFYKENAWRNDYYLEWVRLLESSLSGKRTETWLHAQNKCDAHHVKGHGFSGTVKAPDYLSFPLTREEHTGEKDAFHNCDSYQEWEKIHGVNQLRLCFDTMCKAIDAGVLVVDQERVKELSKQYYENREAK